VEKPLKVEHFFPASGNNGQEKKHRGKHNLSEENLQQKTNLFYIKNIQKTN